MGNFEMHGNKGEMIILYNEKWNVLLPYTINYNKDI